MKTNNYPYVGLNEKVDMQFAHGLLKTIGEQAMRLDLEIGTAIHNRIELQSCIDTLELIGRCAADLYTVLFSHKKKEFVQ